MIKSMPIKSSEDIQKIKSYLLSTRKRDYLLFVLGINIPLKIQDILEMKLSDLSLQQDQYVFKINDYSIFLNAHDSKILMDYIQSTCSGTYLFESIKTKSPLTRQQFHRILSKASTEIGCNYSIGPQALKKTFAYHAYQQGVHIFDLMHILGHATKSDTYHFIDVTPPDTKQLALEI
ncbi:hypothetical protein ETI06_07815 [Macrococcoides goetzii]|nr:tyrosine-type recombinase/integrase [Macrococcus goetzii]TDM49440.1 hypothetical protein ETI06_07815 [Macrococcus goetzii]